MAEQALNTDEGLSTDVSKLRVLYGLTTTVLAGIMVFALGGWFGWWSGFGVETASATAAADGLELAVRYTSVSRGGLATPLDITVTKADGFADPIEIEISRDYLAAFDENGLHPAPASEGVGAETVVWEFDPPAGDELTITFDARLEPGLHRARSTTLVARTGDASVQTSFTTKVWG